MSETQSHSTSENLDCNKSSRLAVGGQALMEGVMIKSPDRVALALRTPEHQIRQGSFPFKSLTEKFKILNLPFIRGIVVIFETFSIGIRLFNLSAELQDIWQNQPDSQETAPPPPTSRFQLAIAFLTALIISIFLFIILPSLLIWPIFNWLWQKPEQFWQLITINICEGLLRVSIFLGYILLISKIREVRRVFQYHGAEHRAIHTFEQDLELSAENGLRQSNQHPRCGTSFVMIAIVISIVVFSLVEHHTLLFKLLLKVLTIPIILGCAFEFTRLTSRIKSQFLRSLLIGPGLFIQRFTTRDPDPEQMEIGLAALQESLEGRSEVPDIDRLTDVLNQPSL